MKIDEPVTEKLHKVMADVSKTPTNQLSPEFTMCLRTNTHFGGVTGVAGYCTTTLPARVRSRL